LDDKFKLCRSIAEECIQESELRNLLDKKPSIVAYDGFEPSGRMHIAQVRCASRFALLLRAVYRHALQSMNGTHVLPTGSAEGTERQ
jgi:hypothetical protein